MDITRDFGSRVLGSNPGRRAIHNESTFKQMFEGFFVKYGKRFYRQILKNMIRFYKQSYILFIMWWWR